MADGGVVAIWEGAYEVVGEGLFGGGVDQGRLFRKGRVLVLGSCEAMFDVFEDCAVE